MTNYVVTGATGFIGRVLVNDLIKLGHKNIKVISRSKKNLDVFNHENIIPIIGDISDESFLESIIDENSIVFHLAGIVDIKSKKDSYIYEINYEGTKTLIDICIKKNVKKIIYSSSSSVINIDNKTGLINEPISFNIKKLTGDYAKSKAMATQYFLEKTKEGLNGVVLYPTAVMGPYDYKISKITEVLIDYFKKKRFFYIKGSYNFVDVRDVSKALVNAYLYGKIGEGYIIGGKEITLDEMFTIINQIYHKNKRPIKIPLILVKALLPILEFSYLIRGKTPIFSRTSLKVLNSNSNFNITKAKKDLNYTPSNIEDSFKDTINWLKENNLLN